jgi:hypothetical protein
MQQSGRAEDDPMQCNLMASQLVQILEYTLYMPTLRRYMYVAGHKHPRRILQVARTT